jgi:hypothetical protein
VFGPLHAGVLPLLGQLPVDGTPPTAAALDALVARQGRPVTACGVPLSFSSSPAPASGYEQRIADSGCVATRDASWHDTFNALAWLAFPQSKAAMNHRHCEQMSCSEVGSIGRGRVRDALTQFDEDGLILVTEDASLLDALREHRWRDALWERRAGIEAARLFVFGHALMEKALAPHFGLCAKALYVEASAFGEAVDDLTPAHVDRWLAGRIASGHWPDSPRDLCPLPVLGLPGMTPDNTCDAYFDDVRQFRPLRPGHPPE